MRIFDIEEFFSARMLRLKSFDFLYPGKGTCVKSMFFGENCRALIGLQDFTHINSLK